MGEIGFLVRYAVRCEPGREGEALLGAGIRHRADDPFRPEALFQLIDVDTRHYGNHKLVGEV
ncbi:hypothetical protein [Sinorhizobium sp. BG8]|uniref:hypothetical protein n=1 Tax=Sinorhizobium sp. BG8 TaxID=2613773 RepID=UPI001FEE2390|nr:hypothetical protein [Sinorhizobium sp. BG8]